MFPIDACYPKERINFIIDDCNLGILLTLTEFKGRCDFKGNVILLDDIEILINKPHEFTSNLTKDDQLAYIMYTSGSTGNPKGVMVSHKNVIRLVINSTIIKYSNRERFMQTGNPVFDATTFEYGEVYSMVADCTWLPMK